MISALDKFASPFIIFEEVVGFFLFNTVINFYEDIDRF